MKAFYFFIAAALVVSCSGNKTAIDHSETAENVTENGQEVETEETSGDAEVEAEETEAAPTSDLQSLVGYYVGDFKTDKYHGEYLYSHYNKINISIDSFVESTVFGHSVVAGNDRPFSGSFTLSSNVVTATAKEPGDDQYDGWFEFKLYFSGRLSGKWIANDSQLTVYQRKYFLPKKDFAYNPNNHIKDVRWTLLYNDEDHGTDGEELTGDVSKFNASVDRLKAEDIENMYKGDLQVIRNSVYARHGYSFKTRKMRYIFDKHVDWYIPVSTDVRDELTELELANVELLKRYEDHAEKYYDTFGR